MGLNFTRFPHSHTLGSWSRPGNHKKEGYLLFFLSTPYIEDYILYYGQMQANRKYDLKTLDTEIHRRKKELPREKEPKESAVFSHLLLGDSL